MLLVPGAYLLPADTALQRTITGTGAGEYDYHSIAPDGLSMSLEGVTTGPGEADVLAVNADGSQIRFTPGADKAFSMQLARDVDDEIRTVSISGLGGAPGAAIDVTVAPDLSVVRAGNTGAARNIEVKAFSVNKLTRRHASSDRGGISLGQDHDLVVTVSDWEDLDLDVGTLSF